MPIAILSAARTPIGRFLGTLQDVPAKDLGITRAVAVDSLAQGRIGTADAVVIVGTDLAK